MPADGLPKGADDQWCRDNTSIDSQVVNLERICASQVFRLVKRSHLTGEISLEHPTTGYQAEEGKQKRLLERHQEMSYGHGHGAGQHGSALTKNAVRQKSAED